MVELIVSIGLLIPVVLLIYYSCRVTAYARRNLWVLTRTGRHHSLIRGGLSVTACVTGVVLISITWTAPSGDTLRGFPLPYAILDDSTSHLKYSDTNLVQIIPWVADLLLGLALPHVPVALLCYMKNRRLRRIPGHAT